MPIDHETGDLTREPMEFPMTRDLRLQALARGDEGFLLALGYSTQRGYGRTHPFTGEIRIGEVEVELEVPELGFAVSLGSIQVTECQMVNQFKGSAKAPPKFTRGYGLVFWPEVNGKAMAMSLVDRALALRNSARILPHPPRTREFVISHSDNVQATGFVEHLGVFALVREPLGIPVLGDAQADTDWIDFVTHRFDPVPYSPTTTVMWLVRLEMREPRPFARACMRLMIAPSSTKIFATFSSSTSAPRLFSALATADSSTFLIR